jgi:hypothetical protein
MRTVLIAKNRVPYGGEYVTKDRLTGMEFRGTNFEMVYNRIVAARKANSLPVGLGFEREVESWLCEDHPHECEEYNPAIPRKPRAIGMGEVINGTKVMLHHWMAGRPHVSREEAERRAGICAACRYNVPMKLPCGGICAELLEIVKRVVGGHGTSRDGEIKACFVCGCELRSAVWTELEIQCKGVDENMKKQFASVPRCWKQCP